MSESLSKHQRPWLTAGLFLALMTYAVGLTAFGPVVGPLAEDLGVSEGAAGALAAWMSSGFLLGTFLCGPLAGKSGLKRPAILGVFLLAGGFALVGWSPSYSWAAAGMALFGLGGALCEITTNAATADLYPEKHATALNLLHVSFGAAALLGPRLAGYFVVSGSGWRTIYLLAAGLALLPLPFYLRFPFPAHDSSSVGQKSAPRPLWRESLFWTVVLAIFFYVGAELSLNNWSVLFLERERGWETMPASVAVSNFWLAMTVGRILTSFLVHRVQPEKLLIGLCLGGLLCTVTFVYWPDGKVFANLLLLGCGFFFSGIFATLLSTGVSAFPRQSAALSSAVMAAAGLAILLLAPAVGYLADRVGIGAAMGLPVLYLGFLSGCVAWLVGSGRSRHQGDGKKALGTLPGGFPG
ncbi:MAG: MFS transporter [Bdellovibrionota bacterium]